MSDPNVAQWFKEMKRVQTVEFREPQYEPRSVKEAFYFDNLDERADDE